MKTGYLFMICLVSNIIGIAWAGFNYKPTGSDQIIAFEKALVELEPEGVDGIYPRQDIINAGIPKNDILPFWSQMIEMWLKRVLQSDYSPQAKTAIAMYGLPEFRWKSDYIVGCYVNNSIKPGELSQRIEFQATDRHLSITICMKDKIPDVNALYDDAILQIVQKYVNVPAEKLSKISLEKSCNVLAGVPICYGKMRCGYHEVKDAGKEKEKGVQWWSSMSFWITEDRLFITVSTIDWGKNDRPASANSRLFKK